MSQFQEVQSVQEPPEVVKGDSEAPLGGDPAPPMGASKLSPAASPSTSAQSIQAPEEEGRREESFVQSQSSTPLPSSPMAYSGMSDQSHAACDMQVK